MVRMANIDHCCFIQFGPTQQVDLNHLDCECQIQLGLLQRSGDVAGGHGGERRSEVTRKWRRELCEACM